MAARRSQRRADGEGAEDAPAQKRSYAPRVAVDDAVCGRGTEWLRAQRMKESRVLSRGELLDTFAVQLHLRHEAYRASLLPGRPKKRTLTFGNETADILRRDANACARVWKEFLEGSPPSVAIPHGPRGKKTTRFRRTDGLRLKLREWLHEREVLRQRTVAKDVMSFLVAEGVIPNPDDGRDFHSALEAVRSYIRSLGYKRGNRKGQQMYLERKEIIVARDKYVMQMMEFVKTRRAVYMDESYIHLHYKSHGDSVHDPDDKRPVPKEKHKGTRLCFIAGIISRDPLIPRDECDEASCAQLLRVPLHVFRGGKSGKGDTECFVSSDQSEFLRRVQLSADAVPLAGKKDTKDYHGMFNSSYMEMWMEALLDELQKRGIENTVIIMDNAKYHKTLPDDTPKKAWKKADLVTACAKYGVPVAPTDTKPVLWDKLQKHVAEHVKPVLVTMAEEAGHTLLYTPPRYSDLQPIELVWAIVKGRVGKEYTTDTKMKDVEQRLKKAFHNLSSYEVQGCIDKATQHLAKLHKHITQREAEDAGEDEEDPESGEGVEEEEEEEDDTDSNPGTEGESGSEEEEEEDD